MSNPAQSARIEKGTYPERYCTSPACLWKTAKPNRDGSGGYILNANPCRSTKHAHYTQNQIERWEEFDLDIAD